MERGGIGQSTSGEHIPGRSSAVIVGCLRFDQALTRLRMVLGALFLPRARDGLGRFWLTAKAHDALVARPS